MSETTYMTRVPFRGERLFEFARRRRLKTYALDTGYAVHCALRELFGELAPQPFALEATRGAILPVLGYGPGNAAQMREVAQINADPWLWEHLIDWDELAAKPMPVTWREGQTLGFSVRSTPVARAAKSHAHHREGAEVDVFLLACRTRSELPEREAVYREWFSAQVARQGGARLEGCSIDRFQIDRLSRRHHAEDQHKSLGGRPDVNFTGTFTVTDPVAFAALLRRGIGRHRAFGFGMLLLRPPGKP